MRCLCLYRFNSYYLNMLRLCILLNCGIKGQTLWQKKYKSMNSLILLTFFVIADKKNIRKRTSWSKAFSSSSCCCIRYGSILFQSSRVSVPLVSCILPATSYSSRSSVISSRILRYDSIFLYSSWKAVCTALRNNIKPMNLFFNMPILLSVWARRLCALRKRSSFIFIFNSAGFFGQVALKMFSSARNLSFPFVLNPRSLASNSMGYRLYPIYTFL